jgi:NAD(P)-dependent dehydrogenase (short-subunit alcohol dehydrogenase family)
MEKLYPEGSSDTRILVTGCSGLIGWNLIQALCELPKTSVYGIDNLTGGSNKFEHKNYHFLKCDVESETFINLFNRIEPHIVYHLAAYAAEGLSPFIRKFNYTNNLVATANVVNCCISSKVHCRLVFTSSMAVYGNKYEPPFTEDMIPAPIDPYGIAKYACEMDIRCAGEQHGLDWVVIRPHNCYDPMTEILTSDGFKFFKDVTEEDFIATLNPDTNILEYHKPTAIQHIEYSGELYHFKSRRFDMLVTPDHKMYCSVSNKNNYKFITADELYNSNSYFYKFKCGGTGWVGIDDDDHIIIPEVLDKAGRPMTNNNQNGGVKRIPMELWVEFLGWYLTEGSSFETPSNYTISISQYEKAHPEFRNRIIQIIKEMGYHPYITDKDIKIHSKQLYLLISTLVPKGARNKFIPSRFKNLSSRYLNILFNTMMDGDGCNNTYRF